MTVKEEIGRWLTLVANFSVVAGILFLAVELHQNNELLEQYRASDLDEIPVHGWSGYIRRYPLALEAWLREKSSLTPKFVRFFEGTLIPASEQTD